MEAIKLKPLSQQALYSQFFHIFGGNYNWNQDRLVRTDTTVTDAETGQVYLLATQEEEEAYKAKAEAEVAYEQIRLKHLYDGRTTPIIDLHNADRWREGLDLLKADFRNVVEMTEDSYNHFLECVPPKRMAGPAFCGGEPYTHDGKGRGIYICCIRTNSGKFYAQYGTVEDFDKRTILKV